MDLHVRTKTVEHLEPNKGKFGGYKKRFLIYNMKDTIDKRKK